MHILTIAQITQEFLPPFVIGFSFVILPFAWWIWVFVTVTPPGRYEPRRRARV